MVSVPVTMILRLGGIVVDLILMVIVALLLVTARRLFELQFRYVRTQRMNCAEVSRSPLFAMHDVGWGNPEFGVGGWSKDDGLWGRDDASPVVGSADFQQGFWVSRSLLLSFDRVQLPVTPSILLGLWGSVISRVVRGDEGLFWVRWIRVPTSLGPVSPASQLWQIAINEVSKRTRRQGQRAYWSFWKWIMKQFRIHGLLESLPHHPEILQPRGDREFRLNSPQPSTPFISSPLSSGKKFFVSWDRASS